MVIRPARWEDLDAVVGLIATQNRAVSGVAGIRAEHVRNEWSLPGFVLGTDNLVAEDCGRAIGYGALTPRCELVLAAPAARVADELLARLVARAGERGDDGVTLTLTSPRSPAGALVKRHRFELDRETARMWRRLDRATAEPRPPGGIALRTFEPADAVAVSRLLDDAYAGWDSRYVPLAHDDWVAGMTGDSEFDASVWWLAEREGVLAGCALHWSSGWLKDVAVAPGERGRGLGAALVGQGLAEFARRGLRRVGLKVDVSNPTGAVRLYERLGFVTADSEWIWRLPL